MDKVLNSALRLVIFACIVIGIGIIGLSLLVVIEYLVKTLTIFVLIPLLFPFAMGIRTYLLEKARRDLSARKSNVGN